MHLHAFAYFASFCNQIKRIIKKKIIMIMKRKIRGLFHSVENFLMWKTHFFVSHFMHLHTIVRIVTFAGKEKQNEIIKIKKIIVINKKEPREFC